MAQDRPIERPDLLTPVLDDHRPPEPLYSARAEFFTAFFGGAFAVLALSAMNASLLGRLRTDLWRYVLLAVLSIVVIVGLAWLRVADPAPEWLAASGEHTGRILRWAGRAYALLVWLLLWLPYRRYHRAAELMGLEPRSPWKAAIGSCVLSLSIVLAVGAVMASLPGI